MLVYIIFNISHIVFHRRFIFPHKSTMFSTKKSSHLRDSVVICGKFYTFFHYCMLILWLKLYVFPPYSYSFRGHKKRKSLTTKLCQGTTLHKYVNSSSLYPDFTVGFGISPNLLSILIDAALGLYRR